MLASCIKAGIDGKVSVGTITSTQCCPPDICSIDPCSFVCSFLNYLPKGPLWDNAKERATAYNSTNTCAPICSDSNHCATIVDHAVYTAKRLLFALYNIVDKAIYESQPETAVETRQDHLRRLGWLDCYSGSCRNSDIGFLTPFEKLCLVACAEVAPGSQMVGTGFEYVKKYNAIQYPADLQAALEHALLVSLSRMQLGVIPNQENINFIIAPLSAEILSITAGCKVIDPCGENVDPDCATDCNQMSGHHVPADQNACDPCAQMAATIHCPEAPTCFVVNLVNQGPKMFSAPSRDCFGKRDKYPPTDKITRCSEFPCETVQSYIDVKVDATSSGSFHGRIYPGLLAAECIVRSLLPSTLQYQFTRN